MTLPSAVDIGEDQLIGSNGANVITFDRTGVHIFEFVTDDAGLYCCNRSCVSKRAIEVSTATAAGQAGDKAGDIVPDAQPLCMHRNI